jgi:hypothetical protein
MTHNAHLLGAKIALECALRILTQEVTVSRFLTDYVRDAIEALQGEMETTEIP